MSRRFLGSCPVASPGTPGSTGFVSETEHVLRTRLRSAAFVLFLGFFSFLSIFLYVRMPLSTPIFFAHVAIVIITGVCSFVLCERYGWRLRQLRMFEYLLFLLPTAYFVYMQSLEASLIVNYVRQTELIQIIPALPSRLVMPWICVIFIYAIFIPNSWQRCAAHVVPMAAIPITIFTVICLSVPNGTQILTSPAMLEIVLWLAIPTATAVFGAQTLNTLRKKAAMARELGSYQLKQRLGTGGMGEVYLGEHKLLKRPCAIKLIRPSQAADPRAIARFESEVQATAKLTHWNTIEIFDYGHTEDGTFYYVMEYLPGKSLQELVDLYGPMPIERSIHLLKQVCDGLKEAHDMGLIHRDIKPGNIFSSYRGGVWDVAKLLDFGLVKSVVPDENVSTSDSTEGLVVGTPLFAAPEWTLRDGSLDPRSDIYSLGAVGYFLITGRPVFTHKSPVKLLFAHANEPVTPPREFNSLVPHDFESVILRCLEKSPDDRYSNVEQLADALQRCSHANGWTQQDAVRWWRNLDTLAAKEDRGESDPSAATQLLEVTTAEV
ncbi:protein kinase [bacterium]|nr:protein kinase [bacterium]